MAIGLFLGGCAKSDENQEANLPKEETHGVEQVVKKEEMRRYFPLAVGNTWTYKRTVNSPPLCSFKYRVEKAELGWSEKGDEILIIGCDPAVNSGTETYRIISQNGTDFIVELKDNNLEDGDGDLRDGRYNFEKLDEVIWSIRKWPEVWETTKEVNHESFKNKRNNFNSVISDSWHMFWSKYRRIPLRRCPA